MRKKILKVFLLWIIIMIFAGALGLLFAKTDESTYTLPILIVGIIGLWLFIEFLHRFALRQYFGTDKVEDVIYLRFKPNIIYKTLISIPSGLISPTGGYYLAIIREQNNTDKLNIDNLYTLNKKPPKWFKYTGDINNPYEIISP